MLNTQTETKDQTQLTSPQIHPEILSALNISQEDVDNLHSERVKLQKAETVGQSKGQYFFSMVESGQPTEDIKIGDFTIPHSFPKADVADHSMEAINGRGESLINPTTETSYFTRGFLEGLGKSALTAKDWKTAIRSYDVITEDGVTKNANVMDQLKVIAGGNTQLGVEIAEELQKRLNKRTPPAAAPQPQAPPAYAAARQPDTPLREAPPNPASSGLNPY